MPSDDYYLQAFNEVLKHRTDKATWAQAQDESKGEYDEVLRIYLQRRVAYFRGIHDGEHRRSPAREPVVNANNGRSPQHSETGATSETSETSSTSATSATSSTSETSKTSKTSKTSETNAIERAEPPEKKRLKTRVKSKHRSWRYGKARIRTKRQ